MGARIEPCSTLQESLAGNEEKLPNLTEKLLFVKYEQLRTVPWMPTKCSSRDKRVLWSTVSNAKVKSNRISITESPGSVANKVSLRTCNKADSVLCRGLKPDWKVSEIWFALWKDCSWINTVFSSAFVINGRFEMGRKWLKLLASRQVSKMYLYSTVYRQGVTKCFKIKHLNQKKLKYQLYKYHKISQTLAYRPYC